MGIWLAPSTPALFRTANSLCLLWTTAPVASITVMSFDNFILIGCAGGAAGGGAAVAFCAWAVCAPWRIVHIAAATRAIEVFARKADPEHFPAGRLAKAVDRGNLRSVFSPAAAAGRCWRTGDHGIHFGCTAA